MAASADSAEQETPSPSNESGAPQTGEAEDPRSGLQSPEQQPGDGSAFKVEAMDGGEAREGEKEEEEEGEGGGEKSTTEGRTNVPAVAVATGEEEGEEEDEEMGSESAGGEESPGQRSPASCSDPGDGAEKEMKQEQREEMDSVSSECNKGSKGEDGTEKSGSGGGSGGVMVVVEVDREHAGKKRRASVEMSSSDGEPLSRMDSEDSISSTLMDMESTVSSGRSTPAMMNGQGSVTPSAKSIAYTCCWDQCHSCFNSSPDLAEHIRSLHVDGQRGGVFVCLWKGCKVYNTPSTSQSWLQRHMLTHSGDKPFKCVVGGCNASFASQGGLARHVPTHFSQQNSSKVSSQPKVKEESPSKAGMNKRRKLKNKRRRSLPRPHDFFDAQTMDAIQGKAAWLNLETRIESMGNGHSVVFDSTVIARRKEVSGKVKVLLHWTPENILPDVWVNENDRPQLKTKIVHLSKLPRDTAVLLDPNIYRGRASWSLRVSTLALP
ncbi:zinc finger protein AEBP2 isoform X3 [Amia ocellicauda]|uniref:zinc finger protein AEBP2 isoform X3 n=1 Tax=Amia ocellicauda TaxID=2972642 RepID=UPI003464459C